MLSKCNPLNATRQAAAVLHNNTYYFPMEAGAEVAYECGMPLAQYQAACGECDPGSVALPLPEDAVLIGLGRAVLGMRPAAVGSSHAAQRASGGEGDHNERGKEAATTHRAPAARGAASSGRKEGGPVREVERTHSIVGFVAKDDDDEANFVVLTQA